MTYKHALTAVILTAALLLSGCLMEGGSTVTTTPPQTLPTEPETEATMEGETYDSLPEVLPIPQSWEWTQEQTTSSATTTQTQPVVTTTAPGIESTEATESGSDIENGSATETETETEKETESEVPGPREDVPAGTEHVYLDPDWQYADESRINSGHAVLYYAQKNRKNIVVGVNAGHGTSGGDSVKTYCHPDHTPKVTGGTTAEGAIKAIAVSSGMDFKDGTPERVVTLKTAQYLRDLLLEEGYDVLMLRDGKDVQLDNVARTVICNQIADCHIAIHWDSDGLNYDKGAYFMSVPDALKDMYPVSDHWRDHEELGRALIKGCRQTGYKVWSEGSMDMDLTQTSYSKVPSVDIEMGNENSDTDDDSCYEAAEALLAGINIYFFGE